MNTPNQTPDSQPFDGRLRDAYDFLSAPPDDLPPLPDHLWAGVEAGLPAPPPPGRGRRSLLVGAGGVILGLLLGWWLAYLGSGPAATPAALPTVAVLTPAPPVAVPAARPTAGAPVATPSAHLPTPGASVATPSAKFPTRGASVATPGAKFPTRSASVATPGGKFPTPGASAATPGAPVSPVGGVVVTLGAATTSGGSVPAVLQPLVLTETTLLTLGHDTTRTTRERRRATLLAQRAALAQLRYRTDSLLLALGEPRLPDYPVVAAAADSTPAAPPLTHRWSVALSFAPERNFFGLQSTAADTLSALRRTHEQGRAGYNAAFMAEYRLNNRWSVGAGLGVSSYGAELRLTDRRTLVTVAYDTQRTQSTQNTQLIYDTYSIRIVQDPVLSPIYNMNFQVIGFDTVFVSRPDTVWTHNVTNGTVVTNTITSTPTVTKRQEMSSRILRPNYRFVTVPLLVRYRLGTEGGTPRNRWWADVALGAQLQFFLGGTQLTSPDGRTWQTERVGANGGPFRPLTVALTGALALNYALTPRLSASLAPTLRWQTESIYKASTGLTQRPAATGIQLGLKLAF